jgi:hypothetical protein
MSIARNSLLSLENYAKQRKTMRERIIEHKKSLSSGWAIT